MTPAASAARRSCPAATIARARPCPRRARASTDGARAAIRVTASGPWASARAPLAASELIRSHSRPIQSQPARAPRACRRARRAARPRRPRSLPPDRPGHAGGVGGARALPPSTRREPRRRARRFDGATSAPRATPRRRPSTARHAGPDASRVHCRAPWHGPTCHRGRRRRPRASVAVDPQTWLTVLSIMRGIDALRGAPNRSVRTPVRVAQNVLSVVPPVGGRHP
jgi:hypothetical protein